MGYNSIDRRDGFVDTEYRRREFEKFTVGEKVKIGETKRFGVIIYKSNRIIVVKYINDGRYKGEYTEAFDVMDASNFVERRVK